jgi:type II secretory pathway pseudopilin PulG
MIADSRFGMGERGLTLIEILLAAGAFAILGVGIAALAYLYSVYSQRLPQEQLRTEVLRAHQAAVEDMKRGIRESGAIVATTTIQSQLFVTGTTTVVLRRPAMDADGFLLTNQYDLLVYTLSGTSTPYGLRKLVEPAASSSAPRIDSILNSFVRELAFSYNHADASRATAVGVRLVTEKTDNGRTYRATSTIEATIH